MNKAELSGVCRQMRRDIINMTANAGSGHPGGSLSGPCCPLLLRGSGGVGLYQPR